MNAGHDYEGDGESDVFVQAPGSCGELVQGTIDGNNFLITCPVDMYTRVTVCLGGKRLAAGEKTVEAVKRTLDYLGIGSMPFSVTVESDLLQGKGMASSSADISAACQAAALAVGKTLTEDEIADIALSIEPTDGVFYPGIVMFDHVSGSIRRYLGIPPAIAIAIFDFGGEVDTLQFNGRSDLAVLNKAKEPLVLQAVELVRLGLLKGDAALIGKGATLSALANQYILPKKCLPKIIEIVREYGAVGVNTAHSGTVVGVLFADLDYGRIEAGIKAIKKACPEIEYLRTVQMVGGGLIIEGDYGYERYG
ncbi:MAG: pduX [Firmicutes bacterium]|nr:pduX [Bacillota bacterium]